MSLMDTTGSGLESGEVRIPVDPMCLKRSPIAECEADAATHGRATRPHRPRAGPAGRLRCTPMSSSRRHSPSRSRTAPPAQSWASPTRIQRDFMRWSGAFVFSGGVTGVGRDWTVKAQHGRRDALSEALESRHGNPRGDLLSGFVAATYEASDSETRDDPLRCPLCSTSRTEAGARLCRRSRCHRAQR